MPNYRFNEKLKALDSTQIWDRIVDYVKSNKKFRTLTGLEFAAQANDLAIVYKGGHGENKRATNGEAMLKRYMLKALDLLKSKDGLCTTTINEYLDTDVKPLFAKRMPFMGLLLSADVLNKVED